MDEETLAVQDIINEYRDALADVQQQLVMARAMNAGLRRQLELSVSPKWESEVLNDNGSGDLDSGDVEVVSP